MNIEFHTDKAPEPLYHYSQAVKAAGMTMVSGQLPLDVSGNLVPGGIVEQSHQVLKNLAAVMESAFLGLHVIVKTTVYLKDINDLPAFAEVYKQYFPKIKPAFTAVEVSNLPVPGALVQADMIACK